MFVVLEYTEPGARPTVMWGEVYDDREDADAFAREQDSVGRFSGRPCKHEVATVVAA